MFYYLCITMGKGRDTELICLRNAALCHRYVYWSEVQRLRPDDVLKVLSRQEFFLSEERILKIIRDAVRKGTLKSSTTPQISIKKPHITYKQLSLFCDDPEFNLEQIHRESRIGN